MKKIKIGIFGFRRGSDFVDNILYNNGDVVAVCDKKEKRLSEAKEKLGETVACYKNFDEFIEHDMDAVLLANYFHEHTDYIIKCFEKNIHVLTECTSNSTMAEGVRLVEAAEKTNSLFMLSENYPFMLFNQEMKKVYEGGTLGKCLYAEGEYNHAGNPYTPDKEDAWENVRYLYDSEKHWRCFVPKTYYLTHSLAPIMFATGASPVRVTAMPIFHPMPRDCSKASYVGEKATVMTCLNDDDSVFKITGHSGFGGSENSYRLCCEKGMIENVRGSGGKVMLRYNPWHKPEDKDEVNYYSPIYNGSDAALAEKAGHGGGDFFVVKEFFRCIRENEKPKFDVYFATRMASVAILGHRSQLEFGVPYDIPDFKKKEDRDKWRNDNLSPFHYSDGREPTMPCCTRPDYKPSQTQIENFRKIIKE